MDYEPFFWRWLEPRPTAKPELFRHHETRLTAKPELSRDHEPRSDGHNESPSGGRLKVKTGKAAGSGDNCFTET